MSEVVTRLDLLTARIRIFFRVFNAPYLLIVAFPDGVTVKGAHLPLSPALGYGR